MVTPATMPEVEVKRKVFDCEVGEVIAAESVVREIMVCANDKDAARSKPQSISEFFRVLFMVVWRVRNFKRLRASERLPLLLGSQECNASVVLVEVAEAAHGVEAVDLQRVEGV